jgi:hypothetical protein
MKRYSFTLPFPSPKSLLHREPGNFTGDLPIIKMKFKGKSFLRGYTGDDFLLAFLKKGRFGVKKYELNKCLAPRRVKLPGGRHIAKGKIYRSN